ncbi:hypothetical protein RB614_17990 [Phytohabitans sp. ZYX-F-186]|uniref:Uncharacterized protein n=1 Tax=Phytohabitans maris TaxID=3071409 RepID=A0ABU0ZH70_9ACTN|nr:hypothetical protein [Phytohabitans sp. ZYX-F-186]MDQ7906409.1 hypothetical protein [Phytohabitans sp. ZYX-F-186]
MAAAIRGAIRAHGGARGVAADVAAAYGDHPETAVPRLRWVRCVVDQVYGTRPISATSGAR